MTLRKHRGQKGFTLIELLIVVAIIGIIAAILIPNLIDALQKAKQKSTVADIRNIGTAWMSWVTDQVSAGAAGLVAGQLDWAADLTNEIDLDDMSRLLEGTDGDQFYLQKLPTTDGWANPLEFRAVFTAGDTDSYRQLITQSRAIGIRSTGRDGIAEGTVYENGTFLTTNYDGDIVWSDGYFVRVPGGLNSADASEDDGGS